MQAADPRDFLHPGFESLGEKGFTTEEKIIYGNNWFGSQTAGLEVT